MQKKSVLYSPRLEELKKKKRRVIQLRVFLFLVLLVSILVGLTYFSRSPKVNISNVEISGNKVLDTEALKTIVNQKLSGKYLWLFPKTNFVLYPKKQIMKELTSTYKRINEITFTVKNATTLAIDLSEREGKYIWCGAEFLMPTNDPLEKCYFMDESGYIFDEAPYFSGNVYQRFYGQDGFDLDNPVGSYFVPESFPKLIAFIENSKALGLKPAIINLPPSGDVEMYLNKGSMNPAGPKIIWEGTGDYGKVFENLQSALATEPLLTDFKRKYSSLLYIDLRFGNKVYFKFQ